MAILGFKGRVPLMVTNKHMIVVTFLWLIIHQCLAISASSASFVTWLSLSNPPRQTSRKIFQNIGTSHTRKLGPNRHFIQSASTADLPSPPSPPLTERKSTTPTSAPKPTDTSKSKKAYPQQTPHSGRHFTPSHPLQQQKRKKSKNRRFMEGWYYRLTLPSQNVSFAFIISIEDPGHQPRSDLALAACQVMGPNDEYLVQADRDDSKFWAWKNSQGLGCTFEFESEEPTAMLSPKMITAMSPQEWRQKVKTGFQVLPTHLQGRIEGHDGTLGGVYANQGISGNCSWDFKIEPLEGWGEGARQYSTAGWLASFPVFEPHWQVTLADARATGTVIWKNQTYQFENQPLYAEKNWGGSFPSKWYWAQCNAFDNYPRLTVTAGGGRRKIPFGQVEDVGMIGVHYDGIFYEAVPWTGSMDWEIDPWGRWVLKGRCTKGKRLFEAELKAYCDAPGVVLRAPTLEDGLVYFCRDSFCGKLTLSLWPLEWDGAKEDYVRGKEPIIDSATSQLGAVEVGGGPWWNTWRGTARMNKPLRGVVRLPYMLRGIKRKLFG